MKRYIIYLGLLITLLSACEKAPVTPEKINDPLATTLLTPLKNEPCTTGTVISDTESTVTFTWKKSDFTDSYDVVIKNLESNAISTHNVAVPTAKINLPRNTPYSWHVVSKSAKSKETAKSEVWKFYNPGPSSLTYAPYPAEILSPLMNAIIPLTGKVSLSWSGSDADNDIKSYDVYFGINTTPPLLSANVLTGALNDLAVTTKKTYYWRVVTKDAKGNSSSTEVYQFSVD